MKTNASIAAFYLAPAAALLSASLFAATPPGPPPRVAPAGPAPLSRLETLGKNLFDDRALSEPAGTACVSCHLPTTGWASNNGSKVGVPLGSRPGVLGLRNAMTNGYSSFVPPFSFRVKDGDTDPVGGHFWDGRANSLAEQALGPFLAANEMNNPDSATVVRKVAASSYANLMRAEFGAGIFNTPDLAFKKIGEAIAAFEGTTGFQPFNSKYDDFVLGKVALADNEKRGMQLFMDPTRGNCASCHTMDPTSKNPKDSLFTDYAFYATGVPRNAAIPDNANPSFFDLGLCGPARSRPALTANVPASVSVEQFCGTFRVATLRNVAQRKAYMHNGVFKSLREAVSFYATRNSNPKRWYGPTGIANDLPQAYLGNILSDRVPFNRPASAGPALSQVEIDDVVAFLETLSDKVPPTPGPAAPPQPPAPGAILNPFGSR